VFGLEGVLEWLEKERGIEDAKDDQEPEDGD